MLDIKFIRENPEKVKEGILKKRANVNIDQLLELDAARRDLIKKNDELRAKKNVITGKSDEAVKIKSEIQDASAELKIIEEKFNNLMFQIPNLPLDDVPVGKDENDNVVLREIGEKSKFDFQPVDYLTLGERLDIIDVKRAAEVSGSRFSYLKGDAAVLEFALVMYTFGILRDETKLKKIADSVKQGYSSKPFVPIVPPQMIKPDVFKKMARLEPKEERYYIQSDDVYLIGSAEHTLGPLHMGEIISEELLPIRYIGFSTSFRREAGSYGKDTKGILRVHQFDKLEMESFTTPEDSRVEQDFIVAVQEYLMRMLKLPYRVVAICTGDMGGPDVRQIDIETWMPGQETYRETHTSDLMTDYQSRRLGTKIKRTDGKIQFAHMNDATAFAIGRTLIAIFENYQQADGSIKIPEVLQKYTGFKEIRR